MDPFGTRAAVRVSEGVRRTISFASGPPSSASGRDTRGLATTSPIGSASCGLDVSGLSVVLTGPRP